MAIPVTQSETIPEPTYLLLSHDPCMCHRVWRLSKSDRRRATSHNGYVHRRRPNRKLQQARADAKVTRQSHISDCIAPQGSSGNPKCNWGGPALCDTCAMTRKGALAILLWMQAAGEAGTLCNRAMRRRKARLQQDIVRSLAAGLSATGKARMLETHVWHAKRMQMATR